MSSDSDIDEDELLQMALKEQAQRDLSYQRPSNEPSKPVVNLIQPPPPFMVDEQQLSRKPNSRVSPAPPRPPRKPSRGGGGDEDDDSEVKLLSISSGDEDSSKDRGLLQRNRAAADWRGSRDDDQGWDGEEPASWKRVDEAELA